ncbi:hypothetical protein ACQP00_16135 [Dactylosporangium sp. CS-047395]|uniref:hypothetical protein n=1 Tax=Dactylosporangium sp. CS-047395 TaxID=3239936 RepID=UPI003D8B88D4
MTIAQSTAASIGRLGLAAAAFGRPGKHDLLLNAAIATGWLSERRTLYGRSLAKDAKIMVTAKEVLVAGTVLTGAANLLAGNGPRRASMLKLNRIFALLGVTATPFINFALFDSYHPHPVRSFLSPW